MTLASPAFRTATPRERGSDVVVQLSGLTKRFAIRRGWLGTLRHPLRSEYKSAVRSVSCEVRRGEFFGLLGPNGAGKTTIFKMLATLVLPDEGSATVAGYDIVRDAALVRRTLAPVIPNERSLFWRLSARENLNLYASLHRLPKHAVRSRVNELLDVVELTDTGTRMVGTFSSGMKQRLLIARALISRPQVLLLDEPTRSLDPISARRFRNFLREEISGRQGCTVLLATHSTEESLELCDRVGILDGGRLLAVGRTDELAREVGEERYYVLTSQPRHPSFSALYAQGVARHVRTGETDADGWSAVELEIAGGPGRAADVVAFLAENSVPIARFERLTLSLADLIERIVQRRGTDWASHA